MEEEAVINNGDGWPSVVQTEIGERARKTEEIALAKKRKGLGKRRLGLTLILSYERYISNTGNPTETSLESGLLGCAFLRPNCVALCFLVDGSWREAPLPETLNWKVFSLDCEFENEK